MSLRTVQTTLPRSEGHTTIAHVSACALERNEEQCTIYMDNIAKVTPIQKCCHTSSLYPDLSCFATWRCSKKDLESRGGLLRDMK